TMRLISYMPYTCPVERNKTDKPKFVWHNTLMELGMRLLEAPPVDTFNHSPYAPLGAFHEAPLRGDLLRLTKGALLEIELPLSDKIRTDYIDRALLPLWIAECIHMVGYYILARWCGAAKGDGMFWIHGGHASVHPVGYCEAHRKRADKPTILMPPHHIFGHKTHADWMDYVLNRYRVHMRYTLANYFDVTQSHMLDNKFKVGDRVETIHDEESSMLMPALVKRVAGRRVLLEYSKHDIDKDKFIDKQMWKDMSDDLIYPVAFASEMGLKLCANAKYVAHTKSITDAIAKKKSDVPYAKHDTKKETVPEWTVNKKAFDEWKVGMVCEVIDRIDAQQNVLKAARVLKVLKEGYVQIGPEGPDINEDSFIIHQTSPSLFPVGYAKKYGVRLTSEADDFDWEPFLRRTNYTPAPEHFFHEVDPSKVPFKPGFKLEAVDQNEKVLCPATVKAVKGRLLLVSFDGWDENYDQLYDFRSNELLPIGWCEMVGYVLQEPENNESKDLEAEQVMDEDEEDEDSAPVSKKSRME
ncbi:hypothetical protein PFISCL1PPCAC_22465, partial [Pristionchus fissidentatus]